MRKSLIDRIQEIADEIEQDGGIIIRRNLSDEELIEIDERFAGLKHREALALSLSENSWTMIRDLIQNERYKELKALITSDLLADADSIISSLSPKTGIVSMFDYLCYPDILEELCDEAPLIFFYRISEGLEKSAKKYADLVLNEIPVPHY
jgi:hypothetical protein